MNEYLLMKLKQLSNATVKRIETSVAEITPSPSSIRRTRGPRNQNKNSKKQRLKDQLKDL